MKSLAGRGTASACNSFSLFSLSLSPCSTLYISASLRFSLRIIIICLEWSILLAFVPISVRTRGIRFEWYLRFAASWHYEKLCQQAYTFPVVGEWQHTHIFIEQRLAGSKRSFTVSLDSYCAASRSLFVLLLLLSSFRTRWAMHIFWFLFFPLVSLKLIWASVQ